MLRIYCAAVDWPHESIVINSAYSVNKALPRAARAADKLLEESAAKLATGKRINSASDNAAGAAVAVRMTVLKLKPLNKHLETSMTL